MSAFAFFGALEIGLIYGLVALEPPPSDAEIAGSTPASRAGLPPFEWVGVA